MRELLFNTKVHVIDTMFGIEVGEMTQLTHKILAIMPQFDLSEISAEEWAIAEDAFKDIQSTQSGSSFKIDKRDYPGLKNSFISVDGKLMVLQSSKKPIGRGVTALAKLAMDKEGNKVVIKVTTLKPGTTIKERKGASITDEVKIENLVNIALGGLFYRERPLSKDKAIKEYQAKEYLGVDLKLFLKDLSEEDKYEITAQILAQLIKLQALGVVHSDLHPGNILILPLENGKFKVTIIDYGNAVIIPEGLLTTPKSKGADNRDILPPEVVKYPNEVGDPNYDINLIAMDELPILGDNFYKVPMLIKDKNNDIWMYGTEPHPSLPGGNLKFTKMDNQNLYKKLDFPQNKATKLNAQNISPEIYQDIQTQNAHTPIAPYKYTDNGYFSMKTDVFSLGVMLKRKFGLKDAFIERMIAADENARPALSTVLSKVRERQANMNELKAPQQEANIRKEPVVLSKPLDKKKDKEPTTTAQPLANTTNKPKTLK
jgi:serine/threonine protein kinase